MKQLLLIDRIPFSSETVGLPDIGRGTSRRILNPFGGIDGNGASFSAFPDSAITDQASDGIAARRVSVGIAMDANEQVATGLVGEFGAVTDTILDGGHIAWHHIRRTGINDTDARKGLLQDLTKLQRDGQSDIFF